MLGTRTSATSASKNGRKAVSARRERLRIAVAGRRHAGRAAPNRAEIGDLRRFESPRRLMGYLGLVLGGRSTGESVHRVGITIAKRSLGEMSAKLTGAGNDRVRHTLIEGAWCHRHPPSTVRDKRQVHERTPPAVTAIARELAGFVWAIGREVQPA